MARYRCRIRLSNGTTTEIFVDADFGTQVRPLVESIHGPGSLLNWTQV